MADSQFSPARSRRLTGWLQPFLALRPVPRRMALALFLWGLGEGMWLYIRPLYVAELGGSPAQAGQVLAVAGLAPVLLMLPTGRLIDRIGSRPLLILGWWIGIVAGVMLALAPNWQWLIPGFFLYAVSSTVMPAVNAYIAQDVQLEAPGSTMQNIQSVISIVFAAYFTGIIVSPVIGGLLGEIMGLRGVFSISIGWFLLSTAVIMGMPRLPAYTHLHLNRGDADAAVPLKPWWRFSRVQLRLYAVLLLLFSFMSLGYILVPSYVENVRGVPLSLIGVLGAATASGGVVWMVRLGRLHSRKALAAAAGLMALAFAGLLWLPVGRWQWLPLIGVYFLLGVYLTVRTLSLGIVSEHAPVAHRGTNYSMVETMFGISAFLGPWVAGMLYPVSPQLPFLVALLALLPLAGLVWVTLRSPATPHTS